MPRVVAIIPARKNSKEIPRKNMTLVAGEPLLTYTCRAALGSTTVDRAIISSDDPDAIALATELGIEAPFLRPAHLCEDSTPAVDVAVHALNALDESLHSDDVMVYLQPTSPLRTSKHIDEAIDLLLTQSSETVVSVVPLPHQYYPDGLYRRGSLGGLEPISSRPLAANRHEKESLFARNGPAIIATRVSSLRRRELYGQPLLGYEMSAQTSVDIDTLEDVRLAEALLAYQTK